jgi:hypothetical protein
MVVVGGDPFDCFGQLLVLVTRLFPSTTTMPPQQLQIRIEKV